MDKKLILTALVIVVMIGGGLMYLATRNNPENTAGTPAADTEVTSTDTTQSAAGAYVDYDEERLANTEGTKVLFFHAPWCPQCRALEASIQSSTIPGDVTIFKVDYDSNQTLRQKYGVALQTTLVKVDDDGNEIDKYVAYDEPDFEAVKANLLE